MPDLLPITVLVRICLKILHLLRFDDLFGPQVERLFIQRLFKRRVTRFLLSALAHDRLYNFHIQLLGVLDLS